MTHAAQYTQQLTEVQAGLRNRVGARLRTVPIRRETAAQHMAAVVKWDSTAELPAGKDQELAISEEFTALPNIGGIISEKSGGIPVTVEVASNPGRPWVVVRHKRGHVAVTIAQAYAMGLREVPDFDLSVDKYA